MLRESRTPDTNTSPQENVNEILLAISGEIARIRNKEDLLHIIKYTLRKYVRFDDSFIMRYDSKTKMAKAYIVYAEKARTDDPAFKHHLTAEYPIEDDSIVDAPIPIVNEVESMLATGKDEVKFIGKTGIKEFVSIKLIEGNQLIGFMILLSERKNSFKQEDLKLLQRVSYPISIATANIIANEEIANIESEKTILLGLSNVIASIRNRKDLFRVVDTQVKDLFSIRYFGIAQINADKKTYSSFISDLQELTKRLPGYEKLIASQHFVNDVIFSKIMDSEDPVLFNVDLLAEETNFPAIVSFWKNANLKWVLGAALRVGGNPIGCVFLHLNSNDTFNIKSTLLKGICAQLAMKIANILAYEEITKREEEKTILLSLSHEIASLKNRDDLFQVVNTHIRDLFKINQFGITKINEDGLTHSIFMIDLGHTRSNQNDFVKLAHLKYKITDEALNSVMVSEAPVILKMDQLVDESGSSDYTQFWEFKQFLCLRFRVGGKGIGCIFFNVDPNTLDHTKSNLLEGICAQLAVAVSNILANEKVLDQITEINKYKQQLEEEKTYLIEELEISHNYAEIIGDGKSIKKIFQLVKQVAFSDSTVLLLGETGTGKELIARAIHNSSPRKNKLMIKVNCAALPPHLIESELFGHERGSFTGAFERRIGKFELADKGTLFLDEIGEMSLDLQAKLLRALQEKEIERIGGKTMINIDTRIIAATNRDLIKLMAEGKFRSDLYYRLNIFPITLPALRDRKEDIPQLTSFFIDRYSKKTGKKISTISNKALQDLIDYEWPGNIRELEHLIERSVLLANGETIREIHLPKQFTISGINQDANSLIIKTIDENEKDHILTILKYTKGRIGGEKGAAELLGVPTSTLNSKMKRLGIRKEHMG